MAVLNIFTDASIITNSKGVTIGCAGFVSTVGIYDTYCCPDNESGVYERKFQILYDSTNNQSESIAVFLGVMHAVENRQYFDRINLISDSQWCIFSLIKWLNNWIYTIDSNGQMYSTSGPVKNQNVFEQIVRLVVDTNLPINFYHCKGHVNGSNLNKALNTFMVSNVFKREDLRQYAQNLNPSISEMDIIRWMADYNDQVDQGTRNVLLIPDHPNHIRYLETMTSGFLPFRYKLTPTDVQKFQQLTSGRKELRFC